MDERRTSKTPHVAGSNAIYVELKDNKSVSVMTREMRRQASVPDVIPDSIPDDDLTPLRRWDKEDQVTRDTIDFIQEMQTLDEQEDVEVGNEGDYFPFTNMEPPEDDPNSVHTDVPENVWKKNRRRRTEDEPSNLGKRGTSLPDEKGVPDGTDSEPDVGIASIAPWMETMEVQRGWGMRLTNVPQGLDITIKIDEERRELRVEFQERIVEKKRESPKKKSVDLTCHYCGALGHKYVHCPARWEVEGRRSTDLRLRVGPSSPLPEDNFCFTCGAAGLPKGHNCSEIASLLASVVNRLAEARPVEGEERREAEKTESLEASSSN
ncbi:hypothetical protein R1sor_016993 [Riccia sorocarpa]|uniref:CCHC-type domain-containing protein n=1 Tax=Riccia sorocarpa TaxID=122646 RepID=A0ABD3I6N5_9MARC